MRDLKNNNKIVRKGYNTIAEQYFKEYVSDDSDLSFLDLFIQSLAPKSNLLDLGCGIGHLSKYLKDNGFEVTGVDFSRKMIEIAKKNYPTINFINRDICNFSRKFDEKYDGIIIAYVLHHLSKMEVENCLINLKLNTKPHTKVILFIEEGNNSYLLEEPFDNTFIYKINVYTKGEVSNLLNKCGYKIDKILYKHRINDPYALSNGNTLVVYASLGS